MHLTEVCSWLRLQTWSKLWSVIIPMATEALVKSRFTNFYCLCNTYRASSLGALLSQYLPLVLLYVGLKDDAPVAERLVNYPVNEKMEEWIFWPTPLPVGRLYRQLHDRSKWDFDHSGAESHYGRLSWIVGWDSAFGKLAGAFLSAGFRTGAGRCWLRFDLPTPITLF